MNENLIKFMPIGKSAMGMDQNANATEEDTNPQREKSSQRSRHLFTMMDHPESEALPLAAAVISPRDMNMFS